MPPGDSAELRRLANGYQLSQALHVAAVLGIADLVAAGPRSSDELAAAVGAHPPSLYRLLRALAAFGVFREEDGRRFASTPLSDLLRRDAPRSLHGWVAFVGRPAHWESWASLADSVRTGESAFRLRHGESVWDYRAGRPDESAAFDAAMTAVTHADDRSLIAAYDFGRFGTVADVGGSRGAFLASLLAAHPAMRGILFDLPHVVAGAGELLAGAGVADRCSVVPGSFFDDVPTGADAYVLKSIVHDWPDEEAVAILRGCRRAAGEHGVVLVLERELGPPNEGGAAKLSDLNMLVGPGGQERSRDEFEALFESAGLRLVRSVHADGGRSVLEARPADGGG